MTDNETKDDPHRTKDVDRVREKVATDGRSLDRLSALVRRVLRYQPEDTKSPKPL